MCEQAWSFDITLRDLHDVERRAWQVLARRFPDPSHGRVGPFPLPISLLLTHAKGGIDIAAHVGLFRTARKTFLVSEAGRQTSYNKYFFLSLRVHGGIS